MIGSKSSSLEDSGDASADLFPRRIAWTTVFILALLYWIGTLDRQIVYLLAEPIKSDLSLTDVQVSLIQGLAFGSLYVAAMVPVGWLVDNYRRKIVISVGAVIWGIGATVSGLSRSFLQLFAARALVGGGEAAILPSSFSIIADAFPANRLALPMSIFTIGGVLGSGMALIGGGLLVQWVDSGPPISLPLYGPLAGWQVAFILTGLPSIIFALVVLLVREPPRHRSTSGSDVRPRLPDLFRHYRHHPGFYLSHTIGFALVNALMVGLLAWVPALLSRKHGWESAQIGTWLGGGQMLVGLVGMTVHGMVVDRMFGSGRQDAHLLYFIPASIISGVLAVLAFSVSDGHLAVVLYSLSFFCIIGFPGIGGASLQIATPPALRGQASAVYLLSIMVGGTILGPLVVASITDYLFRDEASLGYSMMVFASIVAPLCAIVFGLGLAPMRRLIRENAVSTSAGKPLADDG